MGRFVEGSGLWCSPLGLLKLPKLRDPAAKVEIGAELRRQEALEHVRHDLRTDDPRSQAADIDVVVLDSLAGDIGVVDDGGTNAVDFVRGDRRSHPGTADEHSALDGARGDEIRDASSHHRKVDRCIVTGPDIHDLVPEGTDDVRDVRLQRKPRVIIRKCDAHDYPFSPDVAMPSVNRRWNAMKMPTTGRSETTDMAKSAPKAELVLTSVKARSASGVV